jgi:hypothetical protein
MTRPSLPRLIEDLETEIMGLFGHDVLWEHDPSLGGAMSSSVVDLTPCVRYRDFTEAGAAHELLHLRLLGSGFPQIRCYENQRHAWGAATMLSDCLQHAQIFPVLEAWGFRPRETETEGVAKQLTTLRTADLPRLSAEFGFVPLLAMLHVRAVVDCGSPDLAADLKSVCPGDLWQRMEQLSSWVLSVLNGVGHPNPDQARVVLEACLDHLGISAVATVTGKES